MDFDMMNEHDMKENVDINIRHLVNNMIDDKSKPIKRELFKQMQNEGTKIRKLAYIVDSQEENIQGQESFNLNKELNLGHNSTTNKNPCKTQCQLQISQIQSRQSSLATTPRPSQPVSYCSTHSNSPIYSYNFCLQCSCYMLCQQCIAQRHSQHMLLTYTTEPQAKTLTKQFLVEKIEETLQKMKSRENDVKNRSEEVELVMRNVKRLEAEVLEKVESTFREIHQLVKRVYERQLEQYDSRIKGFFTEYENVGQNLRQTLLSVIGQTFTITQFNPNQLQPQLPSIPSEAINKFKSTLQKTKHLYRSITQQLQTLKQNIESQAVLKNGQGVTKRRQHQSSIHTQKQRKGLFNAKKYEKFLQNCYAGGDQGQQKSSLIRILDTLSR